MKIVILSNDHAWTYNLRKEVIEAIINEGHKVILVLSYGKKIDKLVEMGCEFVDIPFEGRGMNFLKELKLFFNYKRILKKLKPDMVLTYTIKPNIYGGYVCGKLGIPFIANITGLGTAVENKSLFQPIFIKLYKKGLKKAKMVFFQNKENMLFMQSNKILQGNYHILPGSGVNLNYFAPLPYKKETKIKFVFISRVMKEKGIDQYLEAAQYIISKYENVEFHICGFCEMEYEEKLQKYIDNKTVIYHGMLDDIREVLKDIHCTVHPTYYPEGLSNVLLESSACARPIITTNRSGCREVIDDGVNGFIVEQQNSSDLIEKIEKFLSLTWEEREAMGVAGRRKVEREFDRQMVVDAYIREIEDM